MNLNWNDYTKNHCQLSYRVPTVHWKRYTAHCVCLCFCPSGQIWQTLSRRWTGQCGACSTCAATVATQREQRYAKGEIVIDGRGGRKRRCALTTTIASLPVPFAPLVVVTAPVPVALLAAFMLYQGLLHLHAWRTWRRWGCWERERACREWVRCCRDKTIWHPLLHIASTDWGSDSPSVTCTCST